MLRSEKILNIELNSYYIDLLNKNNNFKESILNSMKICAYQAWREDHGDSYPDVFECWWNEDVDDDYKPIGGINIPNISGIYFGKPLPVKEYIIAKQTMKRLISDKPTKL